MLVEPRFLIVCLSHLFGLERRKEKPSCFGSSPGPQQRAENCCDDCPFANACDQFVPWSA